MKLTKEAVEKLPAPELGYRLYPDSELPSFGVWVTSGGIKSYYLERRIRGRTRRMKICRAEEKSPEWARNHARTLIGEIIQGKDVVAGRKQEKMKAVTLQEALDDYLDKRRVKGGHKLKPRTKADMQATLDRYLSGWLARPITAITPERVQAEHAVITDKSPAQADLVMRYGRAVFEAWRLKHTGADGDPIIAVNPFSRLSRIRAWNRVDRRKTLIKKHQLPAWYTAVNALPFNSRNYLLLVLFTGLRAAEAAALAWGNVDLDGGEILIPDTKNRRPHELPLSDYLWDLLREQRRRVKGDFVFPARRGEGHIVSVQSAIRQVTASSGVAFCVHDLRRTFATVAEGLDVPAYALKRLLNHAMTDVTSGYLSIETERLRVPMQRITDHLLMLCEARETGEVIPLDRRA